MVIVNYTAFDKHGSVVKSGSVRANKPTEFEAKCGTENFLKKKYPNIERIVVHSCEKDVVEYLKNMFGW